MLWRLIDFCKPFLAGALLAIVGGWIGLFCTSLESGILKNGVVAGLADAIALSFFPWFLVFAVSVAKYGTLLLPIAYFLSRRWWPVTPWRYAAIGCGMAAILMLGFVVWTGVSYNIPLREHFVRTLSIGMGAVLAGAVCGALFASIMRGSYQRYLARIGTP
jgi:hypothetical protein